MEGKGVLEMNRMIIGAAASAFALYALLKYSTSGHSIQPSPSPNPDKSSIVLNIVNPSSFNIIVMRARDGHVWVIHSGKLKIPAHSEEILYFYYARPGMEYPNKEWELIQYANTYYPGNTYTIVAPKVIHTICVKEERELSKVYLITELYVDGTRIPTCIWANAIEKSKFYPGAHKVQVKIGGYTPIYRYPDMVNLLNKVVYRGTIDVTTHSTSTISFTQNAGLLDVDIYTNPGIFKVCIDGKCVTYTGNKTRIMTGDLVFIVPSGRHIVSVYKNGNEITRANVSVSPYKVYKIGIGSGKGVVI